MSTYQDTPLWKKFYEKANDEQRLNIGNFLKRAGERLMLVRDTFPTYTLHNELHASNVINHICDLLGQNIDKLSALEMAILLLSAYYHDIGMVFTDEERHTIDKTPNYKIFLEQNPRARVMVAENDNKPSDEVILWYCRWSHPKRANEILCEEKILWEGNDISQAVGDVCESHGSNVSDLLNSRFQTDYWGSADLRFCAILLRLGDILDFDDTRTPEEVYKYLGYSDHQARGFHEEWGKHLASRGFDFCNSGNENYELIFRATPNEPSVEYNINQFLDVIEGEMTQCRAMLQHCHPKWQSFKLPASISRKHILSQGYKYGDYRFTLEQDQILNLLMGENLYDDPYVFVRELVQNAIDTSRHREAHERANGNPNFKAQPINFTTWTDEDGYIWVRIDDYGMGMDEQIIQDYFLRVGRSYYQSDQFKADKLKYNDFTPISRFGIGVLSCFIAGDYLEVSTKRLGHDNSQNGIRLSMNGLHGFYVVKLESEYKHKPTFMPHQDKKTSEKYRSEYGTSIAVRLKASQYHEDDWLKKTIEKYVFAPPVSVLLNGQPIGFRYEDVIEKPFVEAWEHEFTVDELQQVESALKMKFTTPPKIRIIPIPIHLPDVVPNLRGQAILGMLELHPNDNAQLDREREWISRDLNISITNEKRRGRRISVMRRLAMDRSDEKSTIMLDFRYEHNNAETFENKLRYMSSVSRDTMIIDQLEKILYDLEYSNSLLEKFDKIIYERSYNNDLSDRYIAIELIEKFLLGKLDVEDLELKFLKDNDDEDWDVPRSVINFVDALADEFGYNNLGMKTRSLIVRKFNKTDWENYSKEIIKLIESYKLSINSYPNRQQIRLEQLDFLITLKKEIQKHLDDIHEIELQLADLVDQVALEYPIIFSESVSSFVDSYHLLDSSVTISHNGVYTPLGIGLKTAVRIRTERFNINTLIPLSDFVIVISLADNLRPDVSLARDSVRRIGWNIYSAIGMTILYTLQREFSNEVLNGSLFDYRRKERFLLDEINNDPLMQNLNGWVSMPIIQIGDGMYKSLQDIRSMVMRGEEIEPNIYDIKFRDSFFVSCVEALLQLWVGLKVISKPSEKNQTMIHKMVIVSADKRPLADGHYLFPPLFFVPYDTATELKLGGQPVNENHPFAQWFITNAVQLKAEFSGLFDEFRKGLEKRSPDMINRALRRIKGELAPKPPIIITNADFAIKESTE